MKKLLRNIYCGITGEKKPSGEGYDFKIDFNGNTPEDVVQIVSPYFEEAVFEDNTYWFGYRFNGKVERDKRDYFIKYLKEVQEEPQIDEDNEYFDVDYSPESISEYDLNEMIVRSMRGIHMDSRSVDTIIYPASSSNNLVRIIVKCIRRFLHNSDMLNFVEVSKADPENIEFDIDQFRQDEQSGYASLPPSLSVEDIYNMIERAKMQKDFSLRRDIHPTFVRRYLSNFLEVKKATNGLSDATNVLIVDDFFTTGTTVREIVRIVKKYNPTCNIYIFTLMGNRRVK